MCRNYYESQIHLFHLNCSNEWDFTQKWTFWAWVKLSWILTWEFVPLVICESRPVWRQNVVPRRFAAAPAGTLTPGAGNSWQVQVGTEEAWSRAGAMERRGISQDPPLAAWAILSVRSPLRAGSRFIYNRHFAGWYNDIFLPGGVWRVSSGVFLRSAWGKKLPHGLVVWQQIRLYLLSDSSSLNRPRTVTSSHYYHWFLIDVYQWYSPMAEL